MTLLKKMVLWFSIGIVTILGILGFVITTQLTSNMQNLMKRYMAEYKASCQTFVQHTLLMSGLEYSEDGFYHIAPRVVMELNDMLASGVACYDTAGNYIYGSYIKDSRVEGEWEDLAYAIHGENAYTMISSKNDATAYFSFPIVFEDKAIGIMRLEVDVTQTVKNLQYTMEMLIWCTAALLLVAVALLLLLIAHIVRPINRLSEEIKRMSLHPERADILPVRSQDEIGQLTHQYNKMAQMIRTQMNAIQKEKDNLQRTLEYKKVFYDNLTHELKTPLTIILGYAEMMEQTDFSDKEFARKGAKEIIAESRRLRDMVTALLESSRSEGKIRKAEPVDLCELIVKVATSMNIKSQRYGARIETKLCEAVVLGDAQRLRQLFVNLLDNAIKYGKTKETVNIVMRLREGHIEIVVANKIERGVHIAKPRKVFEPFFREEDVKCREEGSVGLGLSICKDIVEEHNGSIDLTMERDMVYVKTSLPLYMEEGGFSYEA